MGTRPSCIQILLYNGADSQERIAGQDGQERTARTGKPEQDNQDRTDEPGQLRQDSQDRTARGGQLGKDSCTGQSGYYSQDRTEKTG